LELVERFGDIDLVLTATSSFSVATPSAENTTRLKMNVPQYHEEIAPGIECRLRELFRPRDLVPRRTVERNKTATARRCSSPIVGVLSALRPISGGS
jgi:hypothetical protein